MSEIPVHLYNLDITLAELILPLLEEFKKVTNGYPADVGSMDNWFLVIDTMIESFKLIAAEKQMSYEKADLDKIQEGLDLFSKHFTSLWV